LGDAAVGGSPPDAPGWLLKAVAPPPLASCGYVSQSIAHADPIRRSRYAEAALRNAIARVARAPQGQRNDMLNRETFALIRLARAGDLSVLEIAECMAVAGSHAGLTAPEVKATLQSVVRSGNVS
jgi:hypothetical protein